MRRAALVLTALLVLTGCAVAHSEAAAPPRRVLFVGDSVAFDAEPAVLAALRSGGATVVAETVIGYGLTRDTYYDWRARWRALVERARPDVVVAFLGAWDVYAAEHDPDGVRRGYPALLEEARAVLTARGARVVWLSTPWQLGRGSDAQVGLVTELTAAWAQRHDDVDLVDTRPVLGRDPRLRKLDGIHVCPRGAALVAATVAQAAGVEAPVPAWRRGTWRADARYDADFFAVRTGCSAPDRR